MAGASSKLSTAMAVGQSPLSARNLAPGSAFVGVFKPQEARAALGLSDAEEILAVLPAGRRP